MSRIFAASSFPSRLLGCFSCLFAVIAPAHSEALPAKAGNCRIEKKATVQIGYTRMMTVPVSINGTSVTMGLDTGAQTLVTPEAARRLHLPRDYRRKTRAIGTTAVFLANNVIIRDLEFAGAHHGWKSVATLALAGKVTSGSLSHGGTNLAGLLGADVFSQYDLDFDFSKSILTVYSVRGCLKVMPPWTGNFTTIPFQVTQQRRIALSVEIDSVKLKAIFDTGAYQSMLSRAGAFKLGLTSKTLKSAQTGTFVGVGNVSANLPTQQFERLSAAGITLTKRRLGILRTGSHEGDMLLGRDFMASNRFWVSYATRTLFVQQQRPEFAALGALWRSMPVPALLTPAPQAAAVDPAPAAKPAPVVDPCSSASGMKPPGFCNAKDQRSWLTPLPDDEGYLGAAGRNLTAESVKALGLSVPHAVLVTQVLAGGPADEAGMKPGDIVLALDDIAGPQFNIFVQAIRKKKPSGIVRLEIMRRGEHRTLTATLIGAVAASKLGMKGASAEHASAAEEAIAEIFPREKFPLEWAIARSNAGYHASLLITGTVADNLERAIEAYEAALSVPEFRTRKQMWAGAQERLGAAYRQRQKGDTSANIEQAIKAFQEALTVRTPTAVPKLWARDMAELGAAYVLRIEGERTDNIELAIKAYKAALTFLKVAVDATDWRIAQAGLGAAYIQRVRGEKSDNIELAIKAYEAALSAPNASMWAELQRNLGAAYEQRIQGERNDNLTQAAKAYEAALSVLAKEDFPEDHEKVQQLKDKVLAALSARTPPLAPQQP